MTDPADMDGAALGEAVMRAMGWTSECTSPDGEHIDCRWKDAYGELSAPLCFFGRPGKCAAYGPSAHSLARHIEARCGGAWGFMKSDWNRLYVTLDGGNVRVGDAAIGDSAPRALAVAFIRAASGEGRA